MTDFSDTEQVDIAYLESTVPGAIFDATPVSINYPDIVCNYIYGALSRNDLINGSSWGLFIDDITSSFIKSASFTTAWLESNQVTDAFKAVVTKFKRLPSNAKIYIKYRTYNTPVIPEVNVTWNSTTQFTYNSVPSDPFANTEVGDEVTITQGPGAGDVAHITNIAILAGVYTVTLDKAITGIQVNDTSNIIVQKFKLLKTITGGGLEQFSNAPLPISNRDIQMQIKVVCQWSGNNELYELMVVNDSDQYAK